MYTHDDEVAASFSILIELGDVHIIRLLIAVIIPIRHITKYNIVWRWPAMIPHPFALHAEKDPDPSPENFEHLHRENAPLEIIKVIQMRTQLQTPCTPQQRIYDNRRVIELFGMEVAIPSQAPWVVWVVALLWKGEEREIPIARYIPVEAVTRVDHHGGHPKAEQCCFRDTETIRIRGAL
jgi:hypothetical protein